MFNKMPLAIQSYCSLINKLTSKIFLRKSKRILLEHSFSFNIYIISMNREYPQLTIDIRTNDHNVIINIVKK